jgi:uncharacterized protein involved in cysteine biosynthesis
LFGGGSLRNQPAADIEALRRFGFIDDEQKLSMRGLLVLILPTLNGLVWGGLSWMGWDLIRTVESQHVPGFPSSGQILFYIIIPLAMLSVALVPAAFLSQTRWAALGNVWSALTLFLLLPYLYHYGGGI